MVLLLVEVRSDSIINERRHTHVCNPDGEYSPSVYTATDSGACHAVVFAVVRLLEQVLGRRFYRAIVILVFAVVLAAVVRVPLPEVWPAVPVLP